MLNDVVLDFVPQRLQVSQHNSTRPNRTEGNIWTPRVSTCNSVGAKRFRAQPTLTPLSREGRREGTSSHKSEKEPQATLPLSVRDFRYGTICKAIQDLLDREVAPPAEVPHHAADDNGHEVDESCCLCTKTDIEPNNEVEVLNVRGAIRIAHLFNPAAKKMDEAAAAAAAAAKAEHAKPLPVRPPLLPDEERFRAMLERVESSLAAADPQGEQLLQAHWKEKALQEEQQTSAMRSTRSGALLSTLPAPPTASCTYAAAPRRTNSSMSSMSSVPLVPPPPPPPPLVPPLVTASDSLRNVVASRDKLAWSRSQKPVQWFSPPRSVPMSPRMGHQREERSKAVVNVIQSFIENV